MVHGSGFVEKPREPPPGDQCRTNGGRSSIHRGSKRRQMPKLSKNRTRVVAAVDPARKYTVEEACALVAKTKFAKFDETVDLAVRLGVNPKHADQMVRGALVLPHGTGQTVRVLVFAKGEKAHEATAAGADFAG